MTYWLVIAEGLTVGQITYIIQLIIRGLFYGGLSLLTLVVLGHAPQTFTVETHNILNRIVGQSAVTRSSLKWVFGRVVHSHRDPGPSRSFVLAVILSFLFQLFYFLSDFGFMGFSRCTVEGSFKDRPASVQSTDDARAIILANMMNGTDPSSVNSYRCDSAQDASFMVDSSNRTLRICTVWHNSTYGDPTDFRRLNMTDSDVLMPKFLTRVAQSNGLDLNAYFLGGTGQTITEAVLEGGLAVIPHDTGVQLIVGVPKLSRQQNVIIPKTLALEVEMGCMELGLTGRQDTAQNITSRDFFLPDDMYNSTTRNYTGPDYLQQPLLKAANAVRLFMRQWFNMSDPDPSGRLQSFNSSYVNFTWPTEANPWKPLESWNISTLLSNILNNCTQEIQQSLNVSSVASSLGEPAQACKVYSLTGSFFESHRALQSHAEMVCATATQLNMVSASVGVDGKGQVTANLTHQPSDLYRVEADYFNPNQPKSGLTYDPIQRFTLSDNPNGQSQHFIYQMKVYSATAEMLNNGPGSMGQMLSTVGASMVGVDDFDFLLPVINHQYFSLDGPGPGQVTKWGGAVGASYILGSTGYNAWAALDADLVTVDITGGEEAACYDYRYAAAFVPFGLTALLILIWAIVLVFSSRIHGAVRLRKLYGGTASAIASPQLGGPPTKAVLVWDTAEPYLRLVMEGNPDVGNTVETFTNGASASSDLEVQEK